MKRQKILLIENDPGLLGLLALELELQGFLVTTFLSAEEALAAPLEPPTLAVLDYQLCGINGLVLLKQLRRRYPNLPALIISSECRSEQIPTGANSPITHLLAKPFTQTAFLDSVAHLLKRESKRESYA
jgi:DNA-binding response OmpR family regulator